MSDGSAHFCGECGELEYAGKSHNHSPRNRGEVKPYEQPAGDQTAMSLTARLRREFASMFLGTSQNIRQAVKNKDIKDACDIIDRQAKQIKAKDEALKTVLRTRELVLPRKGHLVKAEHREEAAALAKMYASAEQALEGTD